MKADRFIIPHERFESTRGFIKINVDQVWSDLRDQVYTPFNNYEGPNGETILNNYARNRLASIRDDIQAMLDNDASRSAPELVVMEAAE